jgi:hypothetical protein
MGLLSGLGKEIKGLLSNEQFFDRLAQAQAFANGDPEAAARIGAGIRRRRPGATSPTGVPERDERAIGTARGAWPQLGRRYNGYTYLGGDPTSRHSWGDEA